MRVARALEDADQKKHSSPCEPVGHRNRRKNKHRPKLYF